MADHDALTVDAGEYTRLTPAQIRWAASHDWFECESIIPGTIHVHDRYTYEGKSYDVLKLFVGTFEDLRDWAGY